ncbi:winged helix-turn-helix domain-containing protein [archaeon]|nr:winged helix-turn-helix domain-containing protein [archaeon]
MIEDILNSGVRTKIMRYFSKFSGTDFQAIQIAKALNLSVSRTSDCLKYLADAGVLESKKVGKGSIFRLSNSNYLARIILEMFEKERKLADLVAGDFVLNAKK